MERKTIKPEYIELLNNLDGYKVTLYDVLDEVIETYHFGQDLLGAVIRIQQLQNRVLEPDSPSVAIGGFPLKHPNQTTLGN
ncbi:hypothetical protein HN803_03070 [candidate division WWE3 bacterium]|jgi:hypothetical protein|nr:hypothetical protein [candidate division WWE3 bacterium]